MQKLVQSAIKKMAWTLHKTITRRRALTSIAAVGVSGLLLRESRELFSAPNGATPSRKTVTYFGNSILHGWGTDGRVGPGHLDQMRSPHAAMRVFADALGAQLHHVEPWVGASADLLVDLDGLLANYARADLVVVHSIIRDVDQSDGPVAEDESAARHERIVRQIQSVWGSNVLVLGHWGKERTGPAFDAAVAAALPEGARFVDILDIYRDRATRTGGDGFHPNNYGHSRIADSLVRAVGR